MQFGIEKNQFYLNGEPFFLNSAEMHYFRIKKELWPEHLKKIKAAGCNAVSSYIPWDWHEIEEGSFDFTGDTLGERDIGHWLDLCRESGLYNIVKPGPYILAEYAGAGIPAWFYKKFKGQCEVKDGSNHTAQDGTVSFMNPLFINCVKKWYSNICSILNPRQISKGGNIIMMQVCNEVGVFTWLSKQADYSAHCIELYREFLKDKYREIYRLNEAYSSSFPDFKSVNPPSDKQKEFGMMSEIAVDTDWHEFWRRYYFTYIETLIKELKSNGIDIQLYHNLPGWIYGSGYEFPVNITMYKEFKKFYPNLVLGVDHIPENVSYRNMHDDLIINEIVLAQQGRKGPVFGAEFQAGSREYCTVTFPNELDLFYKASLANGLSGWNYYMFSSGKNPLNKGHFGPSFYWFTPLDENAKESGLYPVIRKTSRFINVFKNEILNSKKESEICVLFYGRYYSTELTKQYPKDKIDFYFIPEITRKDAYFNGLLKVLQILNYDFDILDIENCTVEELKNFKQVWVYSCDAMDYASQEKIINYTKTGGNTIIFPTVPRYDLQMRSCTVIKDQIGIKNEEKVTMPVPKADLLNVKDVSVSRDAVVYDLDGDFQVISKLPDGRNCGFLKNVGIGKAMVLGFYIGFGVEEHKYAYQEVIETMGVSGKSADCGKGRLTVKQKFNNDQSLLFVGNYYNDMAVDRISYTDPETGKEMTIPLDKAEISVAPISGFISPINYTLCDGVKLLHTTSDIENIVVEGDTVIIEASGNTGTTGEMALSGTRISYIKEITVDGSTQEFKHIDGHLFFRYENSPRSKLIKIKIKNKPA